MTGVHVYEAIERLGLKVGIVRDAISATDDRWWNLRHGRATWKEEEVIALERFFASHGLTRSDLFDNDVPVLPLGRHRRAKGTVKKDAAA